MDIKKIKRINHIFNYSITAILIGGSITFYCYEKNQGFLIPGIFSLSGVIFGFVTGLVAVQGNRKAVYYSFVIQILSLSLALISFGIIVSI